jgi:hypothetical protein
MDLDRLRTGERIAGISGLILLILLWLTWFNLDVPDTPGVEIDTGLSAWQAFSLIDIIVFITAVSAIALGLMAATQTSVNLPVTLSAIVAGLGILSVLLILFRIISPPDFEAFGVTVADTNRSYGVFLGLLAALGVTYGAWLTMQEEGASFSQQADRARDRVSGDRGPGAPPPPPPPPTGGTGTGTGTGGGPAV